MPGKGLIIVNPAAGRQTEARWKHFQGALKGLGRSFDHAFTAAPGDAYSLARSRAGSYELIAAVGGDGTAFEVINGMMASGNRRSALAIVPFGTGNDTASVLGIRTEADALEAIAAGTPRAVDLIRIQCNDKARQVTKYAMLFASVGITSELLEHTTPRLKRLCGRRLAYIAGLLLALRRYSPGWMKITCDGQETQGKYIFACASNGETFGGGIRIAPGARLDDGSFNVNLIEAVGLWEAIRHIQRLRHGRHTDHPRVAYKTARTLEIETDTSSAVAADGDLIGQTPVRFEIQPGALTVLAPAERP